MRRKSGFGWALFYSAMIHIIVFLTVPMGGTIGDVRDETVRRLTETAVEFVTYVKPKPPPPPPRPQITQRRVVRRVVRRRRVRRPRRPTPKPAEEQTPADQPETVPEPVTEVAPPAPEPEPAPAPEPEPAPTPALAVLPPEPEPAPVPVAVASAPEPQPVVIHPTPGPAAEAAPAMEPQLASAAPLDVPKAAPETASSAPGAMSGAGAPPALSARPAPVAPPSSGGGRAEGPETPGPMIALAPSDDADSTEAPGLGRAEEVAGGEKLAPQMDGAPSEAPGVGGGGREADQPAGTARGSTGPRFERVGSRASGSGGPGAPPAPASGTSGVAGRPGRAGEPGPPGDEGDGPGGPKAAPIRLAGSPVPSGSGSGSGGVGGGESPASGGSGAGAPVRVASLPGGGGLVHAGSPGSGGGGGSAGAGGRREAPSGGGDGDGRGWTLVKTAPREWQLVATAPGVGGDGPGGGQGGDGGMGTGTGGGIGAGAGPGVGPIGPVAEAAGAGSQVPEPLQSVVPQALWGSLVGAFGLGAIPGGEPGGGVAGEGGPWDNKLVPFIVHQVATGTGVGGGAGEGGGLAPGRGGGDVPSGPGGPVGAGILAVGGEGGPGLPPLPDIGDGMLLASAPDAQPGPVGFGLGFDLNELKTAPGGGLYMDISGSFDMPMGVTTGDYQADAPGMVNLLAEVRGRTKVRVTLHERYVPLTLENIESMPVLHLRGHRAFALTEEERETLRRYVAQGGTVFGEDSHGPFGECFRREMRKTFGSGLEDLGLEHEVYRAHYVIDRVPAGDMGERYPLQGMEVDGGRLGVIFSRNDYGDCWEGTGEWVRPETREPAFRMGVNIFTYVVAQWQKLREQEAGQ